MIKLKAVDFFCGAGGMSYGLSRAGISVLAGIDIDSQCKDTYEINNKSAIFINDDIREIPCSKLAKKLGLKRNDDNLILVGCSPCQFWSKVNTNKTKSRRSAFLLEEFEKVIKWFNPGFIVIENVPGLYRNRSRSILPKFKHFLDEHNYKYSDNVVNAFNYGVPQNRFRFLLIASRVTDTADLPEGKPNPELTVRNFIGEKNGFRKISAGHIDSSDFIHTAANLESQNLVRIRRTPKDGGNRFSWKDDPELQINAYKGKDNIFKDVYGRMFWDKPAPTITTRFNSISNGRFGHPEEDRAISLREGAALQTFPKNYVFKAPNQAAIARQIGNAVPPAMAERIGLQLIKLASNGKN